VQRRTAALATSEKRFHELCDLLPQIVFETASDGQLTYLNRAGFEMLGLDDQSVQDDIALSDFVPEALDPQFWTHRDDRNGKTTTVKGSDGNLFPALLYISITVPGNGQRGVRGLLVDISFQKELEQQVIESQKLEALGRLAGGVAHDVNNIVTGISAYAQLIQKHPHRGDDVADSVEKILTGCDRATDLVRHFLVTAGQRQPKKQKVWLRGVVAQVFTLLRPTYGRHIIFENAIAEGVGVVWAEPALVFQVLMNLCVNGAQAMAGSGGSLEVGLVEAERTSMGQGDTRLAQQFYVSDRGPGIETDDTDRIFEPFFTTREHGAGSGIGLFVVRQALADMGGDIRVESEPGQGATFIVSLPTTA
jgi:PAS domain S-box-containing protein